MTSLTLEDFPDYPINLGGSLAQLPEGTSTAVKVRHGKAPLPLAEAELSEMETRVDAKSQCVFCLAVVKTESDHLTDCRLLRLIAEVRSRREATPLYGSKARD